MKILHVLPSLSPRLGGPTSVALHLVRALNKSGEVEAHIATTNDDGEGELPVRCNELVEYEGVPVWFSQRSWPRYKEVIPSVLFVRWLQRQITYYDIVDIHYLYTFSTACAAWTARRKQIPYTMRAMGQLTPWSVSHRALRKRVWWNLLEHRLLESAALVHCTSQGEEDDVRRMGVTSKTKLVPLGIELVAEMSEAKELLYQELCLSRGEPILLFMSRLHPKKRPEWAIRALSSISRNGHLIFAGAGSPAYIEELREEAKRIQVQDRVHFLGFVEEKRKAMCLFGTDLFVLPTHSENFAIAFVEAMGAGLPAVVTEGIQIARDFADVPSVKVVKNDFESFVGAIEEILAHLPSFQMLAREACERIRHRYSWENAARKQVEVYKKIVSP